jgi:hypothetical protein
MFKKQGMKEFIVRSLQPIIRPVLNGLKAYKLK